MDIVDGKLGTVGGFELDLVAGKVVFSLVASEPNGFVGGKLSLEADVVQVLKLVAEKIPGTIDDAIIAVVVAALQASK